jgi:Na+-transporting NADH:ubiquinone oxidoreductase subunit NqrB
MTSNTFKNLAKFFYGLLIVIVCIAIFLWLHPAYGYVYSLIPVLVSGFTLSIIGHWIFG